jgi:muramoyltetrapeptide carboxypeptidase
MTAALPLRPLSPGMRIQLIAPSSPFPREDFALGVAKLEARYEVRYSAAICERSGFLAGSDDRRAAELLEAIEDDSIHAIVAARGGHGATRILSRIDSDAIARHPKPLVGFSDVTALHAQWARAGLGSIHGAMVAALGRGADALVQRWIAALEGNFGPALQGLSVIARGGAESCVRGRLFGGNLTVLTALMGTPYAPPLADAVLFLEDHGERPYRVDRMLTSWRNAGWLEPLRAIVLGAFTDCESGPDGTTIEQVLEANLGTLDIPVLGGVPAGHLDDNRELPLGALAEVDARLGTLSFETWTA